MNASYYTQYGVHVKILQELWPANMLRLQRELSTNIPARYLQIVMLVRNDVTRPLIPTSNYL